MEFQLPQRELKRILDKTQFSMAQQDVRYYLNGLMLEMGAKQLRSVATDGHRLAVCDAELGIDGADGQQVIVPRKGIQELNRLLEDNDDPVSVQIGSNHLRVQLKQLRFTSKLIDGRFPDYDRVLPKDSDKEIVAERESFRQALVRTSILSNEKYRGIRLQLESGRLRVQAHNPEQEEAEEEIEVEYDGPDLEIGFNVNYLLDALNALSGEKARLSLRDANSSCLIQEADASTVPIRGHAHAPVGPSAECGPWLHVGLQRLQIQNLRNLAAVDISPAPGINLIYGANASGKTSLLEAIYLLSRGRSFRTRRFERLVRHGEDRYTHFWPRRATRAGPKRPRSKEPRIPCACAWTGRIWTAWRPWRRCCRCRFCIPTAIGYWKKGRISDANIWIGACSTWNMAFMTIGNATNGLFVSVMPRCAVEARPRLGSRSWCKPGPPSTKCDANTLSNWRLWWPR